MNMQIQSRPFTSEAEYREQAKARKRRLNTAGMAPRLCLVLSKPEAAFTTQRAPSWEWADVRFDEHVTVYRQWCFDRIAPVKSYIKRRAIELGFTFEEMVGPCRKFPTVRARQKIMWELKFIVKPTISLLEIGRVFGGRDHSTVLWALRRAAAAMAKETQ